MTQPAERTLYPSLRGKTVFITGGATGIGACMVEAFLYQGAKVGFVDIAAEEGKSLAEHLASDYPAAVFFEPCDVTDVPALRRAIEAIEGHLGQVDVLINNVANDKRCDPLTLADDNWHSSLAVNLDAAFFTTRAIAPGMAANGGGVIINFSSINALLGPAQMPSYVTAKAGLLGLTRALASDFASDNIRVNAIIPGWVATDKQLEKWLTPDMEAKWMENVRLKRRLVPADVANMALFLASSDAAMITGQQFVVDGGRL
ncbi:SDR family NAD(P)-dependent oxidoreductase [Gilvimarinus algae]|uniref:SDR family NAD(P)-dependent oxidoreductase n=1 Tax=Gilvimarinus algae TaxID=3058037 RepID=A0ABT8TC87_9GAMM|nr:SDR family NAD(P)-dependent oxidoreductase [Gilvimarinus sp. SDUM040014]MDO3381722.1 SDR family NAD(P)-dependent oxidoreductase [Gilvimarinus sp. SDUM040014]